MVKGKNGDYCETCENRLMPNLQGTECVKEEVMNGCVMNWRVGHTKGCFRCEERYAVQGRSCRYPREEGCLRMDDHMTVCKYCDPWAGYYWQLSDWGGSCRKMA